MEKEHTPFIARLKKGIRELYPGYFAMVMATGILSTGAFLLQVTGLSLALFWLNHLLFGVLLLLLVLRLAWWWPALTADLGQSDKGAGLLTLVAAADILGVQHALTQQHFRVAAALGLLALGSGLLLGYAFLYRLMARTDDLPAAKGPHPSWLLLVVATQSLSTLATIVAPHLAPGLVYFGALVFFLLGVLGYLLLVTLLFYRLTVKEQAPEAWEPTYWILMGAASITTLAGATLVASPAGSPLPELLPFVRGATLLAWAAATGWVPLLCLLELRHHRRQPGSLSYQPAYWALVFSLGMYTAATYRLAEAFSLPFLQVIPPVFFWLAFTAWLVTFLGMLISWLPGRRQ